MEVFLLPQERITPIIKRTLEISQESVHVAVQLDQLRLMRNGSELGLVATMPCEDIGLIVVDNPGTTYSHAALARLIDFGAAVIICGRNHLPAGLLLPMSSHTEVVPRLHDQIAVSKPVRKKLWQQIVVAKIRAQARNLDANTPAHGRLLALANEVKSGDPANAEAQAARIYWSVWLSSGTSSQLVNPNDKLETCPTAAEASPFAPVPDPFRRDHDGGDILNAMLNYGYAVVRAAVGRALVSAGLQPALGLMHSNRSNAFCLADDLMEPLRPMVDRATRDLYRQGATELDRVVKSMLLGLLTATVRVDDQTGPLMVSLHRTVASLVRCYQGEDKRLLLPEVVEE